MAAGNWHVPDPIRSARRRTISLFIIVHLLLTLVVNLVVFAGDTFRPLNSATGGLVTGSLVVNLGFIAVLVGAIILRVGGLRPYDIGLIGRNIAPGAALTLAFWLVAQSVHLIAGLLYHGTIALHPHWALPGAAFVLGLLLSQVFGNALFEEIAYRGFLFPQLYLRFLSLRAHPWGRFLLALVVSQMLFALSHIPNRIYLGMMADEIALDLVMLFGWGLLYTLLYLRTDNLFLVVGVHALGNAPTTLFATAPLLDGAGSSFLVYALAVGTIFVWPLLRARRVRLAEVL
jgi:membrane protease YdiL (CAAX protease family)